MANETIKKFKTPLSDLPAVNSETQGYSLRYRIVSDDKNRISHWSPIYLIQPEFLYLSGITSPDLKKIQHSHSNNVSFYSWDSVIILKPTTSVQNINLKSLSSDKATLTTDSAHLISVGDFITVSGVDANFNGTYQITEVTATTFSYYKDSGNVSPTAVSPKGTYTKNIEIGVALDYDIWLRWGYGDNTGDWIYKERIQSTSISYPKPSFYTINGAIGANSINKVSIAIYLKGYPIGNPEINSGEFLKVYELLNQSV
jgi:hypothetical protein